MLELIISSTIDTLIMVLISTLAGILIGIPIAIGLFITDKGGLVQNLFLNKTAGFLVNVIRSIPYIILVVSIIPFTRLIAGTSIGTIAASVPLSLASIMLVSRIVEDALAGVPKGLIEAAKSMGASKTQIIYKVLLPESLPPIISGMTFVIISLIGFSAMAGAVGGGGLGDLAIRYGYQRYNLEIILYVVIILVAMVQIIQMISDYFVKQLRK